MLQTYSFSGPRVINAKGTFFAYLTSAGSTAQEIRVRADGQDLGVYMPGDNIRLPESATMWEIIPTNPASVGTVRIGVAQTDSNRVSGDVSVIDSIDANCQGAQVVDLTLGFLVTQLIAPNTSPQGLVMRSMSLELEAGATGGSTVVCRLLAAPAIPTGLMPTGPFCMLIAQWTKQGLPLVTASLFESQRRLPPNWGVWMAKSSSTSAPLACQIIANWQILAW